MQRILILVWEFPPGPGGIGQHAYSLAETLHHQNFLVTILTTSDYGSPQEIKSFDTQHKHLNIVRVKGLRIIQNFKRVWLACRMATQLRPTKIIFSGKGALWLIPMMKVISRESHLLAFLHGTEVRLPSFITRHLTWFSLRFADQLICVSNFTQSLLPKFFIGSKQVLVLPNGIRPVEFPKQWPLGLTGIENVGAPRLLTVGQLTKRKGQHRVIRALPVLRERWPNIHYHMVGLETDGEELVKLACALNVQGHITIHGRIASREDLYRAYCSVDVFMMLSENQTNGDVEGFGIAILEANYFGLPAIGAMNCGIEDAIEQGVNGYLVDGDDKLAIVQAVEACLVNRSGMQASMNEWVNRHNWDLLIKRLLK